MNKLLKGSIAGAAGVALLLGGAGTFALWNDTATIEGGRIDAGTLTVATVTGAWTDQFNNSIQIDDYDIVPGDVLTYKTNVFVNAVGDNLKAELSVDKRSIRAAGDQVASDVALADFLKESSTLTVTAPGASQTDSNIVTVLKSNRKGVVPAVELTPDNGSNKYVVTVEIEFPDVRALGAENEAMTGAVNLDQFGVTLTQVAN